MRFRLLLSGLKEHREPVILAVMLLLAVLVAFTALAVPMDEDSSQNDGLQGFAPWQGSTLSLPFLTFSLTLALSCGFVGKVHTAEYLKGHIGEKRFSDDLAGLSVHARVESLVTVLFGAPSLFYSRRGPRGFPRQPSYITVPPRSIP